MTRTETQPPEPDTATPELCGADLSEHLLGEYTRGAPGPLFVVMGGLHGNEPAGVRAILEVLGQLEARRLPLKGRVKGLAGNLEALRSGVRFVDRDLNRMWSREVLAEEEGGSPVHEVGERNELQSLIDPEMAGAKRPIVYLDLHSTSAAGSPFSIIGDTLQNRRIAFSLPVPVILGLEENVEGALLGYVGDRGHIAIGFEGGQHDDPLTVRHLVAAIWLCLIAGGGLDAKELPEAKEEFDLLREAGRGLPGVVETRHRHPVELRDGFRMCPGFGNFDRVAKGQLMAHDLSGEIRSPEDGLVLLPLYQGKGQDGFFIAREVRRMWLRVSTVLRKLRLGRLAHWLPGIHQVRGEVGTVDVNVALVRGPVVPFFHLLGYHRCRPVEGHLRFSRRVERLQR